MHHHSRIGPENERIVAFRPPLISSLTFRPAARHGRHPARSHRPRTSPPGMPNTIDRSIRDACSLETLETCVIRLYAVPMAAVPPIRHCHPWRAAGRASGEADEVARLDIFNCHKRLRPSRDGIHSVRHSDDAPTPRPLPATAPGRRLVSRRYARPRNDVRSDVTALRQPSWVSHAARQRHRSGGSSPHAGHAGAVMCRYND